MSESVVILTRNEERWIGPCLASVLGQAGDAEVLVVDAASTDATVAVARAVAERSPRVRVLASATALSVAQARALGLKESNGETILFLSADAEAAAGWIATARRAIASAHVAYGRQIHAPLEWTPASASRSLRYHPFDRNPPLSPLAYASHVNAAYRREVLERVGFPDDPGASALDDVLLARRAQAMGYRVVYEPAMVVLHRDVATWGAERRKVEREAFGWGALREEVGWNVGLLAWAAVLGASCAALALAFGPATLVLAVLALFAPALRRLAARHERPPWRAALLAVAAAPLLDLSSLFHYARGLLASRRRASRGGLAASVRP